MEDYNSLIAQILKNETLSEQIEELAAEDDALNLVTQDWKQVLENDSFYQRLQTDAKSLYGPAKVTYNQQFRVQNLNNESIKMILVGQCSVYRSYDKDSKRSDSKYFAINLKECPILKVLSAAMNSDVENVKFSDTSKLNFGACNMFCKYCNDAREEMMRRGAHLKLNNFQSCIVKTAIYDGHRVMNRFDTQISQMLEGTFIAILKLEFNTRYFYTLKESQDECVRIGGNVLKMIAFPESNLRESKIFLGDVEKFWEPKPDDVSENVSQKRALDNDDEEIIDVYSCKMIKTVKPEGVVAEEELINFN